MNLQLKRILPQAKAWQDNIKKTYLAHDKRVIPCHHFRALLIGASMSGKTNLISNLLCRHEMLQDYFDKIYIFCPTYHSDMNYRAIEENTPEGVIEVFDTLDEEALSTILHEQHALVEQHKEHSPHVLFIFDDCVSEKNIQNKDLQKIFTRGRHANASSIIVGQQFKSIPKIIRNQASNVFVFKVNNSDIDAIAEEYENLHADKNKVKTMLKDALNESYGYFHINRQEPDSKKQYRKGLTEVYDLADIR